MTKYLTGHWVVLKEDTEEHKAGQSGIIHRGMSDHRGEWWEVVFKDGTAEYIHVDLLNVETWS